MSLYKTIRCRHFDDSGHAIKPYCTQGMRCRFIHPDDPQWKGGKEGPSAPPSKAYESSEHRHGSSTDSPRSKQEHGERDHERSHRERQKRDFESLERYIHQNRTSPRGTSDRRSYSYQRSRNESKPSKSVPRTESTKQGRSKERSRTENKQCTTSGPSDIWEGRLSTNENMSDLFRSLIKLCTEIVQDANTLSREEDKLRAFTDLSAELSQASNGSAITVAPTLAAAITSHGECKERIEQHTQELETLWASLFSALERNIVKAVETHLKTAVAMLQEKGRNSDERSRSLADGSLPVVKRRRIGTPEPMETDQELGESLRGLLQGMKSQMDEQTRAIERLSKENQQLKD
ncbi:hypothetical protein V8B97DRAFT_1694998 [Scleroderma yunnanense]